MSIDTICFRQCILIEVIQIEFFVWSLKKSRHIEFFGKKWPWVILEVEFFGPWVFWKCPKNKPVLYASLLQISVVNFSTPYSFRSLYWAQFSLQSSPVKKLISSVQDLRGFDTSEQILCMFWECESAQSISTAYAHRWNQMVSNQVFHSKSCVSHQPILKKKSHKKELNKHHIFTKVFLDIFQTSFRIFNHK